MSDLSRRAILRRVGVVSVAGLGTGAGTYAVLNDSEELWFSAAAGTLDLQLAAAQGDTAPLNFQSESGVTIAIPPFAPDSEASGTATVGIRSCTNPAFASLAVPEIPDSLLATYVNVTLTYVRSCTDPDAESSVLYNGPVAGLDEALGDGVPLSAVDCRPLGKLEFDDESGVLTAPDGSSVNVRTGLPHTFHFGDVSLTVTGVTTGDEDKVIGLDVTTDGAGLCRVDVKGGGKQSTGKGGGKGGSGKGGSGGGGSGGGDSNGSSDSTSDGVVTYNLGCATSATDLNAGYTPSGQQSGLSHATFSVCDGERECIPCVDPACLRIDWSYQPPNQPKMVEALADQTVAFELEFNGTQCRHQSGGNQ